MWHHPRLYTRTQIAKFDKAMAAKHRTARKEQLDVLQERMEKAKATEGRFKDTSLINVKRLQEILPKTTATRKARIREREQLVSAIQGLVQALK